MNEKTLVSPAALICRTCGTIGNAEIQRRGSTTLEVFLYLFAIIPGVFYGYWRTRNKKRVCRACGNTDMIPVGTPAGRSLLNSFSPQTQISDAAQPPADETTPGVRPVFRWALIFILIVLALVSLATGKH